MTLPPIVQKPSPNCYSRAPQVGLIVAHACQGSYAGSVAWFQNPASEVSAHLVVSADGSEVTQCVPFNRIAWHVKKFNDTSIGVEMSGWAEKGFADAEWATEARVIAFLLHAFKLPARWAHGGEGQGFCRHYDLGVAGGGHSDPTTDDGVWMAFVKRVQDAYAAGNFPATWGAGLPQPAPKLVPNTGADLPSPEDTGTLQQSLNRLGARPPLAVDGQFGDRTRTALVRWQLANGIFGSGKMDVATLKAMDQALAST